MHPDSRAFQQLSPALGCRRFPRQSVAERTAFRMSGELLDRAGLRVRFSAYFASNELENRAAVTRVPIIFGWDHPQDGHN